MLISSHRYELRKRLAHVIQLIFKGIIKYIKNESDVSNYHNGSKMGIKEISSLLRFPTYK